MFKIGSSPCIAQGAYEAWGDCYEKYDGRYAKRFYCIDLAFVERNDAASIIIDIQ